MNSYRSTARVRFDDNNGISYKEGLIMKELSQEMKELCEKQELMRLAYTDSRGYARAVPVWYVIIDGNYYMGTYRKFREVEIHNAKSARGLGDRRRPESKV